jgi:hypothetical protein
MIVNWKYLGAATLVTAVLVGGGSAASYIAHSSLQTLQADSKPSSRTPSTNHVVPTSAPLESPSLNLSPSGNGVLNVQNSSGKSTELSSSIQGSGSVATSPIVDPSQFSLYDQFKDAPDTLVADVIAGSGAAVNNGSKVTVQYRAYLTNGKKFDDTYAKNQPFLFNEASGSLFTGFLEGVLGMKVGGERRLVIPPSVAFGAKGNGPVPPNAVIVFDVLLVSVK